MLPVTQETVTREVLSGTSIFSSIRMQPLHRIAEILFDVIGFWRRMTWLQYFFYHRPN
jgi:hypothetical protein